MFGLGSNENKKKMLENRENYKKRVSIRSSHAICSYVNDHNLWLNIHTFKQIKKRVNS